MSSLGLDCLPGFLLPGAAKHSHNTKASLGQHTALPQLVTFSPVTTSPLVGGDGGRGGGGDGGDGGGGGDL